MIRAVLPIKPPADSDAELDNSHKCFQTGVKNDQMNIGEMFEYFQFHSEQIGKPISQRILLLFLPGNFIFGCLPFEEYGCNHGYKSDG